MLAPEERTLLLESLRPPPGYALDRALGTTYSLDLLALLTTPLAFTFFSWEESEDGMPSDPLVLLEALRRNADRIHVFCQVGRIGVPRQHRALFAYLEGCVIEVAPPRDGGVFHPKVWVLRFTDDGGSVRYRLLVLSRNLTFDRSWDTALVLEGPLTDRTNAYAVNHPLGDFVQALPDLAVRDPGDDFRSAVDQVQDEIRRVDFELPPPFSDVRFWPLGLDGGETWPFKERIDRLLVLSPFLSESLLQEITDGGRDHVLVSRLDTLDALTAQGFAPFERVYGLSPGAHPEETDAAGEDAAVGEEPVEDERESAVGAAEAGSPSRELEPPSHGLHAKLYVADAGWSARIWTGSANATEAAFSSNVEFLVELGGRKVDCGIDALLARSDGPEVQSFLDLLEEVRPPGEDDVKPNGEDEAEERLRAARIALARCHFVARLREGPKESTFRLVLVAGAPGGWTPDPSVEIRVWPITLNRGGHARRLVLGAEGEGEPAADFGAVSFEALTSFFAFEVSVSTEGGEERSRSFVLNLPLEGEPAERSQQILRTVLNDREGVLRFLLLLLSGEGLDEVGDPTGGLWGFFGDGRSGAAGELPLLEALLRALDRSPSRLEEIHRFIDDLQASEEGRGLLPDGLSEIWRPIWDTYAGTER